MVLTEIQANPTRVMGWYNTEIKKAWKSIFLLTEVSVREGWLPLSDLAWREAKNPWWMFMTDTPSPEERTLVRERLPQISFTPILCQ